MDPETYRFDHERDYREFMKASLLLSQQDAWKNKRYDRNAETNTLHGTWKLPMNNGKLLNDLIEMETRGISSDRLVTCSQSWLVVSHIMSRNVATISPDETVVSAAKLMSEQNISCLIVIKNRNIVGILTETDILLKVASNGKNFYQMKLDRIMSSPVESISGDISVLQAGKIMAEKHIRRLPVVDKDELVGIVTQTDLVHALTSYSLWKNVSEIMNRTIASIPVNASVEEAANVMAAQKTSYIVAMEGGEASGILTERDMIRRVVAIQRDPARIEIHEVISCPLVSIPADYPVFSAGKMMEDLNVRRLVVKDSGKLYGVVTQTDIFMAVRDKLQAEEEANLSLLEESKNGIYTTDLNGVITYVNPAFMQLLEISDRAELIGQTFLPERFDLDKNKKESFRRELKKGSIESMELALKTARGNSIYVTVFPSVTRNMRGIVNGSQGIVYDITAKKELVALRKVDEQLRQSQREMEEALQIKEILLEEMPFGMIVVGRDKKVRRVNRAALAMMGFDSPDRIVGSVCHDRICPAEIGKCPVIDLDQSVDNSERILLSKDGEQIPILKTVLPISLGGEEVLLEAFVDITERRRAEEALLRLNKDLESAVHELERTNKELQEFAHIAAHDLKTPLRAIGTLADWLSTDYSDKFDQQGREQVKLLSDKAKQMSALIDDILQYSRLGQDIQEKHPIDLNAVLSEVISGIAPPENMEIIIEDDLPTIVSEHTQIVQIFQNLLSNAVKYIDKPEGKIRIGCKEKGNFWKFSVADNGPGIEERHYERIFKIFQTLVPRDGVESTGIGLSIVKKIAELNGGNAWLESKVGEGSTFFFTLHK